MAQMEVDANVWNETAHDDSVEKLLLLCFSLLFYFRFFLQNNEIKRTVIILYNYRVTKSLGIEILN